MRINVQASAPPRQRLTPQPPVASALPRARSRGVALVLALSFAAVGGQLVRLALTADPAPIGRVAMMSKSQATTYARPDIVDRNGRLLATDVQVPSLYADAAMIQDPDETAEKLADLFPGIDVRALRANLADKSKRFVWIKRGLSPRAAQSAHNLGLPGLFFLDEVRRTYPAQRLGGHTLGRVDVDNRGTSGIERYIDQAIGLEEAHGARLSARAPLRLSLDIGVTHAVEEELTGAMTRYQATAAAGVVLDARTGEVLAAVSLPGVDPAEASEGLDEQRTDKLQAGTYELGSVMKLVTVAMALEDGRSLDTIVDTTAPLSAGRYTIEDLHPLGRPLSLAEVFVHSSNVGAGQLALAAGAARQKEFLERLGLMSPLKTEVSAGVEPQKPDQFGRAEQITVSFGHGLAVTPLQFTAAAATLLNGGTRVTPTFLAAVSNAEPAPPPERVVSAATSAKLAALMRLNVTDPSGTGRRAEVAGYRVGGKTGTAEMPGRGGYREKSVIASFLGTFPSESPRYVTYVMLFEPKSAPGTGGEITAGRNAAPATARIVEHIAPLLGVPAQGG